MKFKIIFLCILQCFLSITLWSNQLLKVTGIVDFDKVTLSNNEKIVLIGVSPPSDPEALKLFSPQNAVSFLKSITRSSRVFTVYDTQIKASDTASYAYLITEEGENINISLVNKGLTGFTGSETNTMFQREMIHAQNLARVYRKGIWETYKEKMPKEVFTSNKHKIIDKIFNRLLPR